MSDVLGIKSCCLRTISQPVLTKSTEHTVSFHLAKESLPPPTDQTRRAVYSCHTRFSQGGCVGVPQCDPKRRTSAQIAKKK